MTSTEYHAAASPGADRYFHLGDFVLDMGETLRNARLAYRTHGTLNDDKSNAVLFPAYVLGHVQLDGDVYW